MKLLVFILNKIELLETLLEEFAKSDIKGATILNSTGMARALHDYGEASFLGAIRLILDPDRLENKTIIIALKDDHVKMAIDIIDDVVGGLNNPDTGIAFTMPIDNIWGVKL